jgi:hypothetical protein
MSGFKMILKVIAEKEGISTEEVYHEMQAAIDAGFSSSDPVIQAAWRKMPMLCGKPRPEDVIAYCAGQIKV